MDGRVKTLHPFVHGGILARRDHAGDREALARHGITPIDIVVVNLYPFRETAANPSTTFEALIEDIDIGGPSMIRAAAKNFKDVLVVTSPSDYARVLAALDEPGGPSMAVRFGLAQGRLRAHGRLRHGHRERTRGGGRARRRVRARRRARRAAVEARGRDDASTARSATARTRTSRPAWYVPADAAAADLPAVLQGKELSFTNLLDVDAAARIASEFGEPAAVVIKHTNPCGVATGSSARRRLRARAGRRPALGLRRHRRLQPRDRRGDGPRHRVDVHRGRHRARPSPTRRWPCSRRRRTSAWSLRRGVRDRRGPRRRTRAPGSAHGARRRARPGTGSRRRGLGGVAARTAGPRSSPSVRRPPRSGRRCASRGASART